MMLWMTVTSNRYNTNDPNHSDDQDMIMRMLIPIKTDSHSWQCYSPLAQRLYVQSKAKNLSFILPTFFHPKAGNNLNMSEKVQR